MYKIIALISVIMRQVYIPNPFEALGAGLGVTLYNSQVIIGPECLNMITEPLMHVITFTVVGFYYDRGSAPTLGSLLYLLFYCIHTLILWFMSLTCFAHWAVILILGIYVGCHVALVRLRMRYF